MIVELKDRPLAHLPGGTYAAHAVWVAPAMIAFNIARATAFAAVMRIARWSTVRARIINIPGRLATTGRRLQVHLPSQWPWAPSRQLLWSTATGPSGPHTA